MSIQSSSRIERVGQHCSVQHQKGEGECRPAKYQGGEGVGRDAELRGIVRSRGTFTRDWSVLRGGGGAALLCTREFTRL
jgi:hypothetical protein